MGNGAKASHDSANAERIGNRLAQTELFRDLEIGDRAGVVSSDLKGRDHEIGAVQRFPSFEMGADLGVSAQ